MISPPELGSSDVAKYRYNAVALSWPVDGAEPRGQQDKIGMYIFCAMLAQEAQVCAKVTRTANKVIFQQMEPRRDITQLLRDSSMRCHHALATEFQCCLSTDEKIMVI